MHANCVRSEGADLAPSRSGYEQKHLSIKSKANSYPRGHDEQKPQKGAKRQKSIPPPLGTSYALPPQRRAPALKRCLFLYQIKSKVGNCVYDAVQKAVSMNKQKLLSIKNKANLKAHSVRVLRVEAPSWAGNRNQKLLTNIDHLGVMNFHLSIKNKMRQMQNEQNLTVLAPRIAPVNSTLARRWANLAAAKRSGSLLFAGARKGVKTNLYKIKSKGRLFQRRVHLRIIIIPKNIFTK